MYTYVGIHECAGIYGEQRSVPDLPKLEYHMLGTKPCSPEESSKPSQPLSHLLRPWMLTISPLPHLHQWCSALPFKVAL